MLDARLVWTVGEWLAVALWPVCMSWVGGGMGAGHSFTERP